MLASNRPARPYPTSRADRSAGPRRSKYTDREIRPVFPSRERDLPTRAFRIPPSPGTRTPFSGCRIKSCSMLRRTSSACLPASSCSCRVKRRDSTNSTNQPIPQWGSVAKSLAGELQHSPECPSSGFQKGGFSSIFFPHPFRIFRFPASIPIRPSTLDNLLLF